MPNLVETDVRIVPKMGFGLNCVGTGQVEFRLEASVLVHPYLVSVEVLRVSRQYFGPEDGEHIKVYVRDALKVVDKLAGACEVENGCDVGNGNDILILNLM
ncbi:putative S-adenosyl-L-methionine-dependent methyltransferase [Rosa chinensis]|uniref:Putative S-adenosyl-L-methionine-dependent methyltransferase n=1 Tax=Rosa chinensis TaxID=74649 RepID=A0A2P6SCH0_ROSCH|nr:putative S-adenosyl-L-methionine-dependent methyltransferase [Rosa chinensis]